MSLTNGQVLRRSLLPPLILLLCSCTSFRPMKLHDVRTELAPGQKVRVTTEGGETVTFKVRSVTEDSLLGDGHSVRYEDVRALARSEISWLKTIGLTYLLIGGAALLAGQGGLDFDGISPGS
jgi:hypothetical protein